MEKIAFKILLLIVSLNSFGQTVYDKSKISKKTNQIVLKIEKINQLMGEAVYESGMRPKQYDNFEELKKNTSKNQLTILTKHPNGVVRCYSFWALSTLKDIDIFSIVKEHLNDETLIKTLFGCIGSDEKVGDFFINVATPNYIDLDSKKLSEIEFKKLDSILIYKENNLDSRYRAIENAEPTEFLYPKIRELVVKFNNQSALVTLSKYQKEQDIELILNSRDKTEKEDNGYFFIYQAIQNFPNQKFIPLLDGNLRKTLDNTHYSQEWRQLYKAIATYKNEKALELLNVPFTQVTHENIKKYHIDFVYDAILSNKSSIYDALLWKIWEDEKLITMDGFKYLLQLNPSKTYELTKKELIENYQIKNTEVIPIISENMFNESLEETMLNFIIANDKSFADIIIIDKIENADVHQFEIYSKKIQESKDINFIEPLFKRLLVDDNPHVYLDIVQTLISFKDENINKKIIETRKKNKSMNENWGSNSLDKILKDNNIK
ncbi:hypothetical protein [Flavobacterium sp.]|uniref:hypothetical protein n=1 Tax=Flavobacterium sp. TaxID=239 RepID=UPI0038FC477C